MTKKLLDVLNGTAQDVPPVWLMRQAGRYLPEYKATRAQAGSFLDLCYTPELAEEVTLQPIRRFGFDASILFADILLIPDALGMRLWFEEGEGPMLAWPDDQPNISALKPVDEIDETLSPVYETVNRLSVSLPAETTLIGFAGAPWTVATYMVAGRGTKDQGPARHMMLADPAEFQKLNDLVTDATIHYLKKQIEHGAEVVKIFDSWAGALSPAAFAKYAIEPAIRIIEALKQSHPDVPVIAFPRGAGASYLEFDKRVPADALALDTQVPLSWAKREMPDTVLQGNMDPMYMVVGGTALSDEARKICEQMHGHPHIFNLGHGITPDADPGSVDILLKAIRG